MIASPVEQARSLRILQIFMLSAYQQAGSLLYVYLMLAGI
jgi:hypothetical protein